MTQTLLLPKSKSDSGSECGFSQIFHSGSERKTQNPTGFDSGSGATSVTFRSFVSFSESHIFM